MKRILTLLFLICFILPAKAINELDLEDVGIAKYAVLEAKYDFSPVRILPDENAQRFTHLRQNVAIYADKQTKDFFRIDLGDGNYYWAEKKYFEIQGIIPEKRIQKVDKISFNQDKKGYEIFIPLDIYNAYSFKEEPWGLEFKLYDVDAKNLEIKNKPGCVNYEFKDSTLTLRYTAPALFGYDAKIDKKGLYVYLRKAPKIKPKKPLNNIKIVLDPGHGGEETGVCAFGVEEKDVNLKISKQIRKALKKRGADVYMTRKRDKYTPLYQRVAFADKKEGDILLSIHQNSLLNPQDVVKKHGVGVYYYNPQAKELAQKLQDELVRETGFRDDGVNFASFALTRPTNPVSVLVECGYLIDKHEKEMLTNKKFQKKFANAFTKGVENYLRYLIVF